LTCVYILWLTLILFVWVGNSLNRSYNSSHRLFSDASREDAETFSLVPSVFFPSSIFLRLQNCLHPSAGARTGCKMEASIIHLIGGSSETDLTIIHVPEWKDSIQVC
jgi:hypothetical protein